MKRYTLSELQGMPTITQGLTDDLKVYNGELTVFGYKVWLSRLTEEDGMPYDHMVTVEKRNRSGWYTHDTYQAL